MRQLIVTQNATLDGAVEMLGDWFAPQGQGDQSDLLEVMREQDAAADGSSPTATRCRGWRPWSPAPSVPASPCCATDRRAETAGLRLLG